MLTKADDYPIHQTPDPIAFSGTDRNFYDRYFFNGYDGAGETFFAVAMGIYPHLNILDASFSLVHQGVQRNLRASRILNMERMDTHVGPMKVQVVEPLETLRILVDAPEQGVKADILFRARAAALQEPRFTRRMGPRSFMDYTRLTQNGSYEGFIEIEGKRITLTPQSFLGTRDRSWGVRPVGLSDPQPAVPVAPPQFFWLWAPLNFDDCITLYDLNADEFGRPWHTHGVMAPLLGQGEPETMAEAHSALVMKSGTRQAQAAQLNFRRENGEDIAIELEPLWSFYMSGIGYTHPEWGHGHYKGPLAVGFDSFKTAEVDPKLPLFLHTQAFVRARMTDGSGKVRHGRGVLEQLMIGPYQPYGLTGIFDPAP